MRLTDHLDSLDDGGASMTTEIKTDHNPACWRCGRILAGIVTRPWQIRCQRCKAENASPPDD